MELRGYGSKHRTYLRQLKWGTVEWIVLALLIAIVIGSAIAAWLGYGVIVMNP